VTSDFTEKTMCIQFCLKVCKTVTETCNMLKFASEEETMAELTFKWFLKFKNEMTSVEDIDSI